MFRFRRRIVLSNADNSMVLKQLVPRDARKYFKLLDFDREYLNHFDPETTWKYPDVRSVRRSITHPTIPSKLRFGIWASGKMVGTINLTPTTAPDYVRTVGYWVGKQHIGHGYATQATLILAHNYAFTVLGLTALHAYITPENRASRRTLEKAGFTSLGIKEGDDHEQFILVRPGSTVRVSLVG